MSFAGSPKPSDLNQLSIDVSHQLQSANYCREKKCDFIAVAKIEHTMARVYLLKRCQNAQILFGFRHSSHYDTFYKRIATLITVGDAKCNKFNASWKLQLDSVQCHNRW